VDPILKQTLDWYVFLASQPGWKAQAWHSAQALAKEHPWMFWNLPELLVKEMQRDPHRTANRADEGAG
jgi:hypothetical protein